MRISPCRRKFWLSANAIRLASPTQFHSSSRFHPFPGIANPKFVLVLVLVLESPGEARQAGSV